MNTQSKEFEKRSKPWVIALSILIPVAVAILFTVHIDGFDTGFLPPIYAAINGITALVLIAAFIAIKNKQISIHRKLMTTAIVLSSLFLVLYVIYHGTSDTTHFGGVGMIRYVYFTLLISHILLSIIIIPFVLFTYIRALAGRYEMHRKLAKITFPMWLYVAISGVLVYLLISPYYI